MRARSALTRCPGCVRAPFSTTEALRARELPPGPPVGTPIPVSIAKDGPDPEILEDSEYPSWLWDIGVEQKLTTEEMMSKGLKNLSYGEARQLFRMIRRDAIKKNNADGRKSG